MMSLKKKEMTEDRYVLKYGKSIMYALLFL